MPKIKRIKSRGNKKKKKNGGKQKKKDRQINKQKTARRQQKPPETKENRQQGNKTNSEDDRKKSKNEREDDAKRIEKKEKQVTKTSGSSQEESCQNSNDSMDNSEDGTVIKTQNEIGRAKEKKEKMRDIGSSEGHLEDTKHRTSESPEEFRKKIHKEIKNCFPNVGRLHELASSYDLRPFLEEFIKWDEPEYVHFLLRGGVSPPDDFDKKKGDSYSEKIIRTIVRRTTWRSNEYKAPDYPGGSQQLTPDEEKISEIVKDQKDVCKKLGELLVNYEREGKSMVNSRIRTPKGDIFPLIKNPIFVPDLELFCLLLEHGADIRNLTKYVDKCIKNDQEKSSSKLTTEEEKRTKIRKKMKDILLTIEAIEGKKAEKVWCKDCFLHRYCGGKECEKISDKYVHELAELGAHGLPIRAIPGQPYKCCSRELACEFGVDCNCEHPFSPKDIKDYCRRPDSSTFYDRRDTTAISEWKMGKIVQCIKDAYRIEHPNFHSRLYFNTKMVGKPKKGEMNYYKDNVKFPKMGDYVKFNHYFCKESGKDTEITHLQARNVYPEFKSNPKIYEKDFKLYMEAPTVTRSSPQDKVSNSKEVCSLVVELMQWLLDERSANVTCPYVSNLHIHYFEILAAHKMAKEYRTQYLNRLEKEQDSEFLLVLNNKKRNETALDSTIDKAFERLRKTVCKNEKRTEKNKHKKKATTEEKHEKRTEENKHEKKATTKEKHEKQTEENKQKVTTEENQLLKKYTLEGICGACKESYIHELFKDVEDECNILVKNKDLGKAVNFNVCLILCKRVIAELLFRGYSSTFIKKALWHTEKTLRDIGKKEKIRGGGGGGAVWKGEGEKRDGSRMGVEGRSFEVSDLITQLRLHFNIRERASQTVRMSDCWKSVVSYLRHGLKLDMDDKLFHDEYEVSVEHDGEEVSDGFTAMLLCTQKRESYVRLHLLFAEKMRTEDMSLTSGSLIQNVSARVLGKDDRFSGKITQQIFDELKEKKRKSIFLRLELESGRNCVAIVKRVENKCKSSSEWKCLGHYKVKCTSNDGSMDMKERYIWFHKIGEEKENLDIDDKSIVWIHGGRNKAYSRERIKAWHLVPPDYWSHMIGFCKSSDKLPTPLQQKQNEVLDLEIETLLTELKKKWMAGADEKDTLDISRKLANKYREVMDADNDRKASGSFSKFQFGNPHPLIVSSRPNTLQHTVSVLRIDHKRFLELNARNDEVMKYFNHYAQAMAEPSVNDSLTTLWRILESLAVAMKGPLSDLDLRHVGEESVKEKEDKGDLQLVLRMVVPIVSWSSYARSWVNVHARIRYQGDLKSFQNSLRYFFTKGEIEKDLEQFHNSAVVKTEDCSYWQYEQKRNLSIHSEVNDLKALDGTDEGSRQSRHERVKYEFAKKIADEYNKSRMEWSAALRRVYKNRNRSFHNCEKGDMPMHVQSRLWRSMEFIVGKLLAVIMKRGMTQKRPLEHVGVLICRYHKGSKDVCTEALKHHKGVQNTNQKLQKGKYKDQKLQSVRDKPLQEFLDSDAKTFLPKIVAQYGHKVLSESYQNQYKNIKMFLRQKANPKNGKESTEDGGDQKHARHWTADELNKIESNWAITNSDVEEFKEEFKDSCTTKAREGLRRITFTPLKNYLGKCSRQNKKKPEGKGGAEKGEPTSEELQRLEKIFKEADKCKKEKIAEFKEADKCKQEKIAENAKKKEGRAGDIPVTAQRGGGRGKELCSGSGDDDAYTGTDADSWEKSFLIQEFGKLQSELDRLKEEAKKSGVISPSPRRKQLVASMELLADHKFMVYNQFEALKGEEQALRKEFESEDEREYCLNRRDKYREKYEETVSLLQKRVENISKNSQEGYKCKPAGKILSEMEFFGALNWKELCF